MPIRIKPPVQKTFYLDKSDKIAQGVEDVETIPEKERTKIVVRQAAQGQNEDRNELFAEFQRSYKPDGEVVVKSRLSFDDIKREEVFLTVCACNLEAEDGSSLWIFEKGKFRDAKNFIAGWSQLEPHIADEIHECVLKTNPQWTQAGVLTDADGNEEDTPSGEVS